MEGSKRRGQNTCAKVFGIFLQELVVLRMAQTGGSEEADCVQSFFEVTSDNQRVAPILTKEVVGKGVS
jgi:hypothetical protein